MSLLAPQRFHIFLSLLSWTLQGVKLTFSQLFTRCWRPQPEKFTASTLPTNTGESRSFFPFFAFEPADSGCSHVYLLPQWLIPSWSYHVSWAFFLMYFHHLPGSLQHLHLFLSLHETISAVLTIVSLLILKLFLPHEQLLLLVELSYYSLATAPPQYWILVSRKVFWNDDSTWYVCEKPENYVEDILPATDKGLSLLQMNRFGQIVKQQLKHPPSKSLLLWNWGSCFWQFS